MKEGGRVILQNIVVVDNGRPFRSNQGSSESIYIGLSYTSYPAHMHRRVPGIDVERWQEGNMTKCCHSQ